MHISKLASGMYHVCFRSQQPLGKTFVRFQEYFESPRFRHHFFSLPAFRHWYIAHSPAGLETGRFTFYQDWGGFNVPSHILQPFYQGKFNPLTIHEHRLLDAFADKRKEKFYLIGTYGNHTKAILRHEIAHALFYLNSAYRKEVIRAVHQLSRVQRKGINSFLASTKGYHPHVWLDETHTYIMTLLDELRDDGNIDIAPLLPVHKELNRIFRKHFQGQVTPF